MTNLRRLLLTSAISSFIFVAGCGGSSGGGSSAGGETPTDEPTPGGTSISGVAEAPAGAVAALEPKSLFEIATAFIITPVAAAITGLTPVGGATVELIRIDNDGNQVGDVLASALTDDSTGTYELNLPAGVALSGDLIVRISGANDISMSAQVVDEEVDINPISDFVLRKFVQSDADLSALALTEVVSLKSQANDFDLVAGASISAMLETLELELGEFVESQVEVVTSAPGAVSGIAGDYRSAAFNLDLHDANESGPGTYYSEMWTSDFSFSSAGDGTVTIEWLGEQGAEAGLYGDTLGSASLWYETYEDSGSDSFPGSYSDAGVLSVQGEAEEEVNGDSGERRPAVVYNFQQVKDKGLFVLLSQESKVRYATIDTNDDGVKDAINLQEPVGDELSRSLEVFARKPTAMTDADLSGDFGRVYFESFSAVNGPVELRSETNIITFHGNGTLDVGAINGHSLVLSDAGSEYAALNEAAEEGLAIDVTADGEIVSVGGGAANGFVNDTFDFVLFADFEGADADYGQFGQTLLVKLPATQPEVAGKKYRMMFLALHLGSDGNGTSEFYLTGSQFNNFVTMTSESEGAISGAFTEIAKTGLNGNLSVEKFTETELAIETNIASNGATSVIVDGEEGNTRMEGYFNEDASMGIFAVRWEPIDGGDPSELGVAVLVEVD